MGGAGLRPRGGRITPAASTFRRHAEPRRRSPSECRSPPRAMGAGRGFARRCRDRPERPRQRLPERRPMDRRRSPRLPAPVAVGACPRAAVVALCQRPLAAGHHPPARHRDLARGGARAPLPCHELPLARARESPRRPHRPSLGAPRCRRRRRPLVRLAAHPRRTRRHPRRPRRHGGHGLPAGRCPGGHARRPVHPRPRLGAVRVVGPRDGLEGIGDRGAGGRLGDGAAPARARRVARHGCRLGRRPRAAAARPLLRAGDVRWRRPASHLGGDAVGAGDRARAPVPRRGGEPRRLAPDPGLRARPPAGAD